MITALLLAATLLNPTGKPAKAHVAIARAAVAPQVQVDTMQEIDYLKKINDIYEVEYENGESGDYEIARERSHLRDESPRNGSHLQPTYYEEPTLYRLHWDT